MNESCVQILSLTQFATLFLPSRIDEIHRTVEKGTHLERREKKLITIHVYVYIYFKVSRIEKNSFVPRAMEKAWSIKRSRETRVNLMLYSGIEEIYFPRGLVLGRSNTRPPTCCCSFTPCPS